MKYAWVDNGNGRQTYRRIDRGAPLARSSLPVPQVILDTMPETEHVDGRFYTSKSAYRAVTKAHGLTEVGNEKPKPFTRKAPDEAGIRASVQKAMARLKR